MTNIDPQVLWIAGAVVAAVVIIFAIAAGVRRSRSERLREHFGSEYDHTLRATGSRTAAEQELVSRAEEVKTLDIRPLSAAERDRYSTDWTKIEQQFVNRPTTAVVEADELITDVMRTRGYPMADFETHAAHLSVKHPRVVEHYRAGHSLIDKHGSTEDLRQAMLHYRALFDELVNEGVDVQRDVATEYETNADRERRRLFTSGETRSEERPR
ncbi:MAG TPA: hypothetical protein VGJ81_17320 [Thermoanaerobaculia bacterium]|jgi:hypothetical protein